jgi:hypothetical protein
MKSLHYEYSNLGPDDVLEVRFAGQAIVQLLDDQNYRRYCCGESFSYYGGLATMSPCHLSPSRFGKWHLVIDSAANAQTEASVRLIQYVEESLAYS